MSLKSAIGLDWFEMMVHLVVTGLLMVALESVSPPGRREDVLMTGTLAASVLLLNWRRTRALKHQGRAIALDDDRMEQLEERLADLETAQQRIMELEERVDFTERMLARERDLKLGAGRED